jgi:hypothetical protein
LFESGAQHISQKAVDKFSRLFDVLEVVMVAWTDHLQEQELNRGVVEQAAIKR